MRVCIYLVTLLLTHAHSSCQLSSTEALRNNAVASQTLGHRYLGYEGRGTVQNYSMTSVCILKVRTARIRSLGSGVRLLKTSVLVQHKGCLVT